MIDIYYLEEDARIAQSVKEFLTQGGCRVYVFATLDGGLSCAKWKR